MPLSLSLSLYKSTATGATRFFGFYVRIRSTVGSGPHLCLFHSVFGRISNASTSLGCARTHTLNCQESSDGCSQGKGAGVTASALMHENSKSTITTHVPTLLPPDIQRGAEPLGGCLAFVVHIQALINKPKGGPLSSRKKVYNLSLSPPHTQQLCRQYLPLPLPSIFRCRRARAHRHRRCGAYRTRTRNSLIVTRLAACLFSTMCHSQARQLNKAPALFLIRSREALRCALLF